MKTTKRNLGALFALGFVLSACQQQGGDAGSKSGIIKGGGATTSALYPGLSGYFDSSGQLIQIASYAPGYAISENKATGRLEYRGPGCYTGSEPNCKLIASLPADLGAISAPKFDLEVADSIGASVYKESTGFGVLQMVVGNLYTIRVNSNIGSVTLQLQDTSGLNVPGVAAITIPTGSNYSYIAPAGEPKNYRWHIVGSSGGEVTSRDYDFSTTCDDTTVFPITLANMSVTGSAVYTYNAKNMVPNMFTSTGKFRFECSWDFNGDGIRDSEFGDCDKTDVKAYSNHVQARKIRVYVRDKVCNKVQVADVNKTLTDPNPVKPEVFIRGDVSSASTDARFNVKHVSVNRAGGPAKAAECNYSRGGGFGSFSIAGLNRYDLGSSRSHGVTLTFENITDNLSYGAGNVIVGSLNGSTARVKGVEFKSDEAPDVRTYVDFAGSNQCVGVITVSTKNVSGSPCAPGNGHSGLSFTVVGEGTYSCSGLPDTYGAGRTINVNNGSFYCEFAYADSCSGGGGGGGGIVPIYF